jgi:HSP20 family protein
MAEKPTSFTDIEKLFEEFVAIGPTGVTPELDVIEADENVTVVVDLPGRDPGNIDVSIEEGRQLTIETGRREKHDTGQYLTQERTMDAVSRTVALPMVVDEDKTRATYDAGVLTITLPKEQADGEGTQIPVE